MSVPSPAQRSPRDISQPPHPKNPIKQSAPPFLRVVLVMLSVIVLVVSGAGWATVGRVGNEVASAGGLSLGGGTSGEPGAASKGEAADGATDILLVGSDSRSDTQGNPLTPAEIAMLHAGDEQDDNTDTLMVIRVPNDGSSATAISIPRDTYIHDPVMGNLKINGVYAAYKNQKKSQLFKEGITDEHELESRSKMAGRAALIRAINRLTGIKIDHYAEIGLLGFVLLTDAVGGVEVCLKAPVHDVYSHANFPAGRQTLNGPEALSFVRQRHGLPRGDLDRITRQQAFMASLVNKILSNQTLKNPTKLAALAGAVSRSVIIDSGWDILAFANQLQNLAGGRVKFATIPVTSIDGRGDHGESIVTVDQNQVHEFFQKLLGGNKEAGSTTPAPQPKPHITVNVTNATLTTGLAGRAAAALSQQGWTTGELSTAQQGLYSHSEILAGNPSDPGVQQLSHELKNLPVRANASLQADEVVVVVAADYPGPLAEAPDVVGNAPKEHVPPSPIIVAGGDGPRCVN